MSSLRGVRLFDLLRRSVSERRVTNVSPADISVNVEEKIKIATYNKFVRRCRILVQQ